MFRTPNVPVFMQKASVEGRGEDKRVRFTFYITPFRHALAAELSPVIADLLFTFDTAGAPHPIQEMDLPHFNIGKIPLQLMEMRPSDDPAMEKYATMMERVQISNLIARKIYPDDPNFTLEFRAEVPMNSLSMDMIEKFYQEKLFLTFEDMQMKLPTGEQAICSVCDDVAICMDEHENYFCEKDRGGAVGEVAYIAKLKTPAEAAAPDENDDASHINKPKGGRRGGK
jgi:hypothetical protein